MKAMRIAGIALLSVVIIGALTAGYSLIIDPTGKGVQLTLAYIEPSPFSNYLIPGIILFTVIGLFGLVVLSATLDRMRHYEILQLIYGVLLTGWIVVQILMVEFVYYLHFVIGGIGIYMMVLGIVLVNSNSRRSPHRAIVEFYQTLK